MVTLSKALHLKMKLGDTMRLTLYANRTLNRKEVEIKVGQLEVRVSDHLDAQCHSRRVTTGFDHVCALAGTGELFASFRLWHAEPHKIIVKKVRFAGVGAAGGVEG
jgi:hypothetical protein